MDYITMEGEKVVEAAAEVATAADISTVSFFLRKTKEYVGSQIMISSRPVSSEQTFSSEMRSIHVTSREC